MVQLLLEDIVCSRMEVLQNLSLIISMLILQKCANVNQYMIGVTMEKNIHAWKEMIELFIFMPNTICKVKSMDMLG